MRPFPFLHTMRAQLTLWNVFILALVLLTLGGVLHAAVTHKLMDSIDRELARRVRHHKQFWATFPWASHAPPPRFGEPGEPPRASAGNTAGRKNRLRQTLAAPAAPATSPTSKWRTPALERVFDLNGTQSYPPFEREAPWDSRAFALAVEGMETSSFVRDGEERVRVLTAPLRRHSGEIAGVVQVGYSLAELDRTIGDLNSTLLTLIPVGLFVAAMGGLFLTWRMLRPLRLVNQSVALMTAEDLSRRLVVSGQDEFSSLATNFNAMLSRLERSFEQQRRFTADASHELRTPLTVVKAHASLALSDPGLPDKQRKAWRATERAANLMNAIVQDLLLLARSDAGQLTLDLRPTFLWDSVEAAREAVQIEGSAAITNKVPNSLMVSGDSLHLSCLFTNLLKNALRHTPSEGRITITAEVSDDTVAVIVADTGAGIAPEHLPHVLERFYRADEARTRAGGGTGLGLAICQSIVSAHGGSLEIESSLGVGTTVQIALRREAVMEPPRIDLT